MHYYIIVPIYNNHRLKSEENKILNGNFTDKIMRIFYHIFIL